MLEGAFYGFRSNLLGTHFTVFDSGDTPKKGSIMGNLEGASRKELAGIVYVSGIVRVLVNDFVFPN